TLEETSDTLIANDDHIIILGASKKVRSVLEKTDLFEIIGKNMLCEIRLDALKMAKKLLETKNDAIR
ncbi:MAG: hypothetical protein ACI80L_002621, partial [Pseudohongiellaceae bacterium]